MCIVLETIRFGRFIVGAAIRPMFRTDHVWQQLFKYVFFFAKGQVKAYMYVLYVPQAIVCVYICTSIYKYNFLVFVERCL